MPNDHEVGYKRPPLHSRFKKGQSGNRRGRPKGARNLKTELEAEFREKIVVREGKTRKAVSKQRAMLKGLMAKAVQGDPRTAALLANLAMKLLEAGPAEATDAPVPAVDRAILQAYEARIRGGGAATVDGGPAPDHVDGDDGGSP